MPDPQVPDGAAPGGAPAREPTKHVRVREELQVRLASMAPGEPLPAERDLARELGVARMTLRRAVDSLVADALLVRRQGSGTFLAPPKVAQRLSASSFSADMRARGLRPGARTISSGQSSPGVVIAAVLGIPPTSPVLHVRRLRLADDVPMAIEDLHVPLDLVPGLTGADLQDRSFYDVLAERYGLTVVAGTQTVEAALTTESAARDLEVAAGSPAFCFERTSRVASGRVVEFVRSVYRGDRYRLVVDIFPPSRERA
jgi:GntR family transcriptional regulator